MAEVLEWKAATYVDYTPCGNVNGTVSLHPVLPATHVVVS